MEELVNNIKEDAKTIEEICNRINSKSNGEISTEDLEEFNNRINQLIMSIRERINFLQYAIIDLERDFKTLSKRREKYTLLDDAELFIDLHMKPEEETAKMQSLTEMKKAREEIESINEQCEELIDSAKKTILNQKSDERRGELEDILSDDKIIHGAIMKIETANYYVDKPIKQSEERIIPGMVEKLISSGFGISKRSAITQPSSTGGHYDEDVMAYINRWLTPYDKCNLDKKQEIRLHEQETISSELAKYSDEELEQEVDVDILDCNTNTIIPIKMTKREYIEKGIFVLDELVKQQDKFFSEAKYAPKKEQQEESKEPQTSRISLSRIKEAIQNRFRKKQGNVR